MEAPHVALPGKEEAPAPTSTESEAMDRLKRSSRQSVPTSGAKTVRRRPTLAASSPTSATPEAAKPAGGASDSSGALIAQGSKGGGLTAQETAVIAKQLKDTRLKLQAADVRAKESEAKLAKLINAVKDDRSTRSKEQQTLLKEKAEAEKRANEAEVALLNVVDSLKENERKQKDRYDAAIASTTKKAEAAVERANKLEEKMGGLLQMMRVGVALTASSLHEISRLACSLAFSCTAMLSPLRSPLSCFVSMPVLFHVRASPWLWFAAVVLSVTFVVIHSCMLLGSGVR